MILLVFEKIINTSKIGHVIKNVIYQAHVSKAVPPNWNLQNWCKIIDREIAWRSKVEKVFFRLKLGSWKIATLTCLKHCKGAALLVLALIAQASFMHCVCKKVAPIKKEGVSLCPYCSGIVQWKEKVLG